MSIEIEPQLNEQQTNAILRRTSALTELSEDEQLQQSYTQVSSVCSTQQLEATTETSYRTADDSPAPLFHERKRHYFSYDANELQRRTSTSSSNVKTEILSSGTAHSQHTTASGDDGFYECNICFDTATYPVLTLCGHLFCWSCLAQWLNIQALNPICPVCKTGCGKDRVIPVYGRGRQEKDPRHDPSIPNRPAGQRPPPLQDPNRPRTSFFGQNNWGTTYNSHNVTFSGGIGFFPFGISFNIPINGDPTDSQSQNQQNAFISRLFFMVLSLVLVAIIFF
ncbi:hypothetical protein BCR42DRAFT_423998 [Absidia repens]|uniref:RING-type E3 ubiquitin transferase n=1 Tax=Absidia repens TaxID=90262 RepID=A0A1X2I4K5_9FUNG|nr:hypothetical protein BCR42DRAFT_423998 [Absidia repens]